MTTNPHSRYEQGQRDARDGHPRTSNPYAYTADGGRWENGWLSVQAPGSNLVDSTPLPEGPEGASNPDAPVRWVVATFRHANVGGTMLVLYMDQETVTFALGPTPWGGGSWGAFPRSCVTSIRPLRADDSWPCNGCPERRWTPSDLLRAYQRARFGLSQEPSEIEQTLAAAIAKASRNALQAHVS